MPPVDGNGVYEISTREQLNWAARNNTLDYRLMNDIAIDGYFSLRGFSGTFDGNGHKLTGLTFKYNESFITNLKGEVKKSDLGKRGGGFRRRTSMTARCLRWKAKAALWKTCV